MLVPFITQTLVLYYDTARDDIFCGNGDGGDGAELGEGAGPGAVVALTW